MLWWVCDPATGDDPYCERCEVAEPGTTLRERQGLARCPLLPVSEHGDEVPALAMDKGAGCEWCPASYARSPAGREAYRAWRWWDKGQLALVYPTGVPQVVADAVEVADATSKEFRAEGARLAARSRE